MQSFLIAPKQQMKLTIERLPSITEKSPNPTRTSQIRGQRLNLSTRTERNLQNDDYATKPQSNSYDPEPFLPTKILNTTSNNTNTSVLLYELKLDKKQSDGEEQNKSLIDTKHNSVRLPLIEQKSYLLNDVQQTALSQLHFQDISDDYLGFRHNILLQSSQDQQVQNTNKKYTRQSTMSNTSVYLSNSPKRAHRNSILSNQFLQLDEKNNSENEDQLDELDQFDQAFSKQQSITIKEPISKKMDNIKKFKNHSLAIKAAIRIKLLLQKKRQQLESDKKYLRLKGVFSYKDKLVQNKIKQWVQMALTKVLTTLHQSSGKQWDFIDSNLDFYLRDLAVTNLLSIFNLLLTNLEIMTRQNSFLPELSYQQYLEQYTEYRQNFNIFVSKRTSYITNTNHQINPKERAMIFTECIIMNNFIPNLILLTENKQILNPSDSKIPYLLRAIITLLQMLFISTFKDMAANIPLNQQFQYRQYQIGRNRNGMVLIPIVTDEEEFFKGTFKKEQIQLVLDRKEWYANIQIRFKQIVENLSRYRILDF